MTRLGLLLLIALAGLAATKERPAPRQRLELATFSLVMPESRDWKMFAHDWEDSVVHFHHVGWDAKLSAFWEPVFFGNTNLEVGVLLSNVVRDYLTERYEKSPDYQLDSVQETAPQTIGRWTYRQWRMELTKTVRGRRPERFERIFLARVDEHAPDMYFFLLTMSSKALSHRAECERALQQLAAGCVFKQYRFSDVAPKRLETARNEFRRLAEAESKQRNLTAIIDARNDLLAEIEVASRFLTNSPQPLIVLGEVQEYNSEFLRYGDGFDAARAESSYRDALQRYPHSLEAHERLARLFEALGRVDDAERHWRTAIEIEPSNGECHYKLARFLQRQQRDAEALDELRLALRFWQGAAMTKKEVEEEVAKLAKKSNKP